MCRPAGVYVPVETGAAVWAVVLVADASGVKEPCEGSETHATVTFALDLSEAGQRVSCSAPTVLQEVVAYPAGRQVCPKSRVGADVSAVHLTLFGLTPFRGV